MAFCRWPSRWRTLSSWAGWVALALVPWPLLTAVFLHFPKLQAAWLRPVASGAWGQKPGWVPTELGEPVAASLRLGALSELQPLWQGVGLLGFLVAIGIFGGALRRGVVSPSPRRVWVPLWAALIPLAGVLSIAVLYAVKTGGVRDRLSGVIEVVGAKRLLLTVSVTLFALLIVPHFWWRRSLLRMRRTYGAVELGATRVVCHQSGAWGASSSHDASELLLSISDTGASTLAFGSQPHASGALSAAASMHLDDGLALARSKPGDAAPRPTWRSRSLAACYAAALLFTCCTWGVWWGFPALGCALAGATSSFWLFERVTHSRRAWESGHALALVAWGLFLAGPPPPLEATFERIDGCGNRVLVTSRPGNLAYRVCFISGEVPGEARALRASSPAGWPTLVVNSRGAEQAQALESTSGFTLWASESASSDPFEIIEEQLEPPLKRFFTGESSRRHYRVVVERSVATFFVADGRVVCVDWEDAPGSALDCWSRPPERMEPDPVSFRDLLPNLDSMPTLSQVESAARVVRDDECWRTMAPNRSRGFHSLRASQIGWEVADHYFYASRAAFPEGPPRPRSVLGLPRRSPHSRVLAARLGRVALETAYAQAPPLRPRVELAIRAARLDERAARIEVALLHMRRDMRRVARRWAPTW